MSDEDPSSAPKANNDAQDKTHGGNDSGAVGDGSTGVPQGPQAPRIGKDANTDSRKSKPGWWAQREHWRFIIEIGLFVVGIVVACIYKNQLSQMIESNRINREALESVQRAFVTYGQSMEAIQVPQENNRTLVASWEFRIKMTNSGATPTKDAIQYINSVQTTNPLPENFDFRDGGDHITTRFIIGPKDTGSSGVLNFSVPQLVAAQSHTARLYFYGWTTYHDIFPNTPLHVTMFCMELSDIHGDLTKTTSGQSLADFALCFRHNCADNECDGEPYSTGLAWHAAKK